MAARMLDMDLTNISSADYDINMAEMENEIGVSIFDVAEDNVDELSDSDIEENELMEDDHPKENVTLHVNAKDPITNPEVHIEELGVDQNHIALANGEQSVHERVPNVAQEFIPTIGMNFKSEKKAYEFYNFYARLGVKRVCAKEVPENEE